MEKNLLETTEALLRSGQYADAEKQLNEVIRNAPEDWQAKMLLGTALAFQKKQDILDIGASVYSPMPKNNSAKAKTSIWIKCLYNFCRFVLLSIIIPLLFVLGFGLGFVLVIFLVDFLRWI